MRLRSVKITVDDLGHPTSDPPESTSSDRPLTPVIELQPTQLGICQCCGVRDGSVKVLWLGWVANGHDNATVTPLCSLCRGRVMEALQNG